MSNINAQNIIVTNLTVTNINGQPASTFGSCNSNPCQTQDDCYDCYEEDSTCPQCLDLPLPTGSQGAQESTEAQGAIGATGASNTNSTAISITDTNTAGTFYLTFVSASGASQTLRADITTTPLTYVPSTSTLTATNFSGLASTATNIAGGLGGSIPYQSAVNTTALLANGTAGQVLTSAGTTIAPTWTTPPASQGLFQFDDFPYSSSPQGSMLGLRASGTFTGSGLQQIGSISGYTGVIRGGTQALAQTVSVSSYSSFSPTYYLFNNIATNGTLTFIFRPFFDFGTANAICAIGICNATTSPATATVGVYWSYDPTALTWRLYNDAVATGTVVLGTQANVWSKITITRTGSLTWSSTWTVIGGATTTGTGTLASSTTNTYIGWWWGNNSSAGVSKFMDIDYCSATWNSNR
jgi:hypothetical protein